MSIYNLQTLLDDLTIPRARRFNKRLMVWTWRGSNFHERLRVLWFAFHTSHRWWNSAQVQRPTNVECLTARVNSTFWRHHGRAWLDGGLSHGFEVEFEMISAKPYTQTVRILYDFFLGLSGRFPGYVHKLGQLPSHSSHPVHASAWAMEVVGSF